MVMKFRVDEVQPDAQKGNHNMINECIQQSEGDAGDRDLRGAGGDAPPSARSGG